jgi:hypothetical protein
LRANSSNHGRSIGRETRAAAVAGKDKNTPRRRGTLALGEENRNGGAIQEKTGAANPSATQRNSELGRALSRDWNAGMEMVKPENRTRTATHQLSNPKIKQNRKNEGITQDVKIEIFH